MKRGLGSHTIPVWTDARRKQSGYGTIKGMLQTGTLILPRFPDLLRELRGLEYTNLPSGMTRIAAGGRGHDDLAMALMQAVSCASPGPNPGHSIWGPEYEHTRTPRGTIIPSRPVPHENGASAFRSPVGAEKSAEGTW
jgi:hypothetical protein